MNALGAPSISAPGRIDLPLRPLVAYFVVPVSGTDLGRASACIQEKLA
jgi:hypothetical protein